MTSPIYVANASPIIAFERLGRLDILQKITARLYIPTAVRAEVFGNDPLPEWIIERALTQPLSAAVLSSRLGPGESEAIALAMEVGDCYLLLDDLPARRLAESLRIQVIGTLGVLCMAKRRGLIEQVNPFLNDLLVQGFRISSRLYAQVLKSVGE